jgi:hypothetical protein
VGLPIPTGAPGEQRIGPTRRTIRPTPTGARPPIIRIAIHPCVMTFKHRQPPFLFFGISARLANRAPSAPLGRYAPRTCLPAATSPGSATGRWFRTGRSTNCSTNHLRASPA